ncbi:V-type proton ATPase subunit c''2 [Astathelohania contejeani]|uniref:V-type proton ATPase subunit c''2 n=1 Tax=Astathelohania contejeani TaxID=164912 RepID=A0ABQ7HZE6_9MICR|nr:V-type proton ATPase subunit c''2 [Thelohania contejeani]
MYSISKILFISILALVIINTDLEWAATKFAASAGYIGAILCFGMGGYGTARGVQIISKAVAGACIKTPQIAFKAMVGTIVCEANFMFSLFGTYAIISALANNQSSVTTGLIKSQLLFAAGILIGSASYTSSLCTAIVCSSVTIMDSKDRTLFSKLVIVELLGGSIGVFGFVIGYLLKSRVDDL